MKALVLLEGAVLFVVSVAVTTIIKNEYNSWASRLARLVLRTACLLQLQRSDEWHAEIAVAQDAKESGLGDALFYLIGSVWFVIAVKNRVSWPDRLGGAWSAVWTFVSGPRLDLAYQTDNPYSESPVSRIILFALSGGTALNIGTVALVCSGHWLPAAGTLFFGTILQCVGAHFWNNIVSRARAVGMCNLRTISRFGRLIEHDFRAIDQMIEEANALFGFLQGIRR